MHWLLIDFCLWSRTRAVHIVRFLTEHFNERVFSSILSPHSHVILHAGLARSCRIHCLMNARETFSPRKGCSIWRMSGDGKSSSSELIHRLQRSTHSRRARLIFRWWILQLCLRLRAEWQSVSHIAKSESFRTRETKQKWVWYYMHWFLIDFCFW